VNTSPVFRECQRGDFNLHPGFFDEVLQLLVPGVRDLIADSEQTIDRRRIEPLKSYMFICETGAVRDTPWCLHPTCYRNSKAPRCSKENTSPAKRASFYLFGI
jgi:hypothetical protein